MEKRDIIVIAVALLIVLVMAMYVKPLVTGKEAKLIPDEISSLFKKEDVSNDTHTQKPVNINSESIIKPSYTSISPNESDIGSKTTIEIEGKDFKSQMEIQVFSDLSNFTLNTSMEEGKLVGRDAVFPEKGDWIVKIFDPDLNITYNTQHVIHVQPVPTPEPTWDGTPKPLNVKKYYETGDYYTGRSYPVNPINKAVKKKIYTNFGGVRSVDTAPINIPYPYWDIIYTVNFQTEIAKPKSGDSFEFNLKDDETHVESVGYKKPFIKIIIKNEDDKTRPAIEITPPGGIDPLQWDEGEYNFEEENAIKDPRPWNERIYGAGNYSFQVFVQSIDSYNIKIEVPELEAGHEKNLTISIPMRQKISGTD